MHLLLLIFISAASFWSILPVKLVAIAGTVYAVTQLIKRFVPQISGPYAVLLNVALSVTGVLSVAKPGDLASPAFWASLLMTAGAAAGIHGTVRSAIEGSAAPTDPPVPAAQLIQKA